MLWLVTGLLHAADFTIYINSDQDPFTGCAYQGADLRVEASVGSTAPYYVDTLQVSKCINGSFAPPVATPAGFTVGLDNGLDGSDVVEIAIALNLLELSGTELIDVVVVTTAPGSTQSVILLPSLSLSTGQLVTDVPPAPIPSLSLLGLAVLISLLLLAGTYFLPGQLRGMAVLLVVVSGVLVAQTLMHRFVADGRIDDWAGYPPAVTKPTGSGSPLTEVRQLFFAVEGSQLFVRLDVTEIEAPDLTNATPGWGALGGGYPVELSGRGFLSTGTSVSVDGTDCTAITVIDPTRLTCTLPAHAAGQADIVVTTPAGQSPAFPFTYQDPGLTTMITGTAQAISFHKVQLTGAVATATTATPSYQWKQIYGEPVTLIGANTPDLSFEAPGVSIGQSLEFRLDTSAGNLTGHATHVVTIFPETVSVDAGSDVQTLTDTDVSLHAVGHSEGGALTWAWTQLEGDPVTINGAASPNATFKTPSVAGTLKFEVTVTDPANVTGSDIIVVTVSPKPATVLTPASVTATTSGNPVTLQVHVNGGTTLPPATSISWTQVSGPAVTLQGGSGMTPSFIAPAVQQPTQVQFQSTLKKTDGKGAVTYVTAKIHPPPNTSPLHVDAGLDQTAEARDTLQLHVDVLSGVTSPSYQWTQLAGRPATLVNAGAQSVTVDLPAIPDVDDGLSNKLLFEVAVTDGARRGSDTVEIQLFTLRVDASVSDPALLSRGFVLTGDTVHLTSHTQRAKAPVTASWTQTGGPAPATLTDADRADASALLPQSGSYTFEVMVTDLLGNTDTESVTVTAADPPPPPPVVMPSVSQLTATVTGGSTRTANITYEGDRGLTAGVHYAGEAAPPTITWQQTLGPPVTLTPSADGKTVQFDAPLVSVDTLVMLEATVNDGVSTVTVPVDYLIQDRLILLSVNWVADSYVGKSTTLHGLASGGGGTLVYQWTQIPNGAPTAPLQDKATSVAHFTAATAGTYVFELTVTDTLNNSASARVTTHVLGIPAPPTTPQVSPIDILFPPPVDFVEGNSVQYVASFHGLPTGAQVAWTETLGLVGVTITPDGTDPQRVDLAFPAVTGDTAIQLKVTVTDGGTVLQEATSPRMLVHDHPVAVLAQVNGSGSGIRVGDTVHLGASATGTSGAVAYLWTLKSGTGTLSQATTANPSFVPGTAGTAELEVTATDALGNTGSATVAVTASFTHLVFNPAAQESKGWPADAASSGITLHVMPTGGSGQFRFDYTLEVYEYKSSTPGYEDNNKAVFPLTLDSSNPRNPAIALTDEYFVPGRSITSCSGRPCDTAKARLQITVTDTQTGETKSGTTNITWGGFSPAQQALVSTPPRGLPNCNASQELEDRKAAWKAATAAGVPVGQYVCSGPPMICEESFHAENSKDRQNVYGILNVKNHASGARDVVRKFGDRATAAREWLQVSSSVDRCQTFYFGNIYTIDFECTYAYVAAFENGIKRSSGCNIPSSKTGHALFNSGD